MSDPYLRTVPKIDATTTYIPTGDTDPVEKGDVDTLIATSVASERITTTAEIAAAIAASELGERVTTVAELETAVAAQIAGQFIYLEAGTYTLTESLAILLASTGGGLIGIGEVQLDGLDAADEAVLVDIAVATGTFEYTFENLNIKGGTDKIGLNVANGSIGKKTNVLINNTYIEDNGTGSAVQAINTDGSNAIRIYWNGGAVDTIDFTPSDTGDRLVLKNMDVDVEVAGAAVDVVATYFFANSKLPVTKITGGHASNVISTVGCWTEAVAYVPVAVAGTDFPDAFSATIL